MAPKKKKIMGSRDIERALNRIALQVLERNPSVEHLVLVGIYTGGVYLAERLQNIIREREGLRLPTGSLDITLYRDDWSMVAQNPIVKKTDIQFPLENKVLVLVDDVLFTGRTVRAAMDAIMDFGRPGCIQLAVLVDRGGRELPIQPDFTGMKAKIEPDEHIHVLLREHCGQDEVQLEKHP
jgi:pyrimidine operon attenuation protein/uracil phosphoribosyltransferase